jgi:flagellar biosynthetic protein FliQ
MSVPLVVEIGRELLVTALLLAAPSLLVSLIVGVLISIFQTVTSIQEQTLTFAPRIVAVSVALIVTLPWSIRVLVGFTTRMMQLASHAAS